MANQLMVCLKVNQINEWYINVLATKKPLKVAVAATY